MSELEIKQIESEYLELKKEIESNSAKVYDLIKLMLTVTIGILSLGFTEWLTDYELVYLIPIFLIVPISLLIESQINSTERIGSYLRVIAEPNLPGYNWETNLKKFRSLNSGKSKYTFSIITIMLGLSFLCYSFFLIGLVNSYIESSSFQIVDYWDDLATFVATVILLRLSLKRLKESKSRNNDEKWESIIS